MDALPAYVKLAIIDRLLEDCDSRIDIKFSVDHHDTTRAKLLPLSAVSQAWHDVALPYLFRDLNLSSCPNVKIATFIHSIAPKYGHFCRSFRFSLSVHEEDVSDIHIEEGSNIEDILDGQSTSDAERSFRIRTADHPRTFHEERNSLLTKVLLFVPNITHVHVSVWDCPCYDIRDKSNEGYEGTTCQCLTAYHGVVQSLANHSIKSITAMFYICGPADDGSDDFVSSLLQNARETLDTAIIRRRKDDSREDDPRFFRIKETLDVLAILPHITHLTLDDACAFSHLLGIEWICPLRVLTLMPAYEDMEAFFGGLDVDVGLALQHLPGSIKDLNIMIKSGSSCGYSASVPFPSQLAGLRNLHLNTTTAFSMFIISYFYSCRACNVFIDNSRGDEILLGHLDDSTFDMDHLVRAVKTRRAFPEVEHFELIYPFSFSRGEAPRVCLKFESGSDGQYVEEC